MTRLPILCYHKVGPEAEEGRRLNIEPARLAQHVRYFQRRGYRFLRGGDLGEAWPERGVAFTFDDGYVSTLTHGLEVFRRAGVPATVYAVPFWVGRESGWDAGGPRPLGDWDLLRQAQAAGWEVGNHTWDHPHLNQLSPDEQSDQIRRGDAALRAEGLVPRSVCYPYGHFSPETPTALRAAGQTVGLAIRKRWARGGDDRALLPRVVIAFSDALPLFVYKVFVRGRLRRGE